MKDLVVILSYYQDRPAIEVLAELERRHVPVLLLDPGDFPCSISLDASFQDTWEGTLTYHGQRFALSRVKSILYRRPTHYVVDKALPPTVQVFAENEAFKGFGGILRSLDCFWVSHPDALRAANFKPRQLQVAKQHGMRTPRTEITNDPAALLRFYEECHGRLIYKTLYGGNVGASGDEYDAIYTSIVTPESLQHAERVRYTAHLFQEHIEKAFDVRVTVVGDAVFAAAIDSQEHEATRVDFRASYAHLRYRRFQLPKDIEQACVAIVHTFGLEYGAIDMAVTPSGDFVWFELNPNGQYQWIEYHTKLPITSALVDLLVCGKEEVYVPV